MSETRIPGSEGISVITPVYNEVEWLDTTVPAILGLSADEWIFVDDGSTDRSPALLSSLIDREPRAHLIRLGTNQGRAVARNTAIEPATQPWLAFVNANVRPLEGFLEAQFQTLREHPDAVASVGRGVFSGSNMDDPYHAYLTQGRRGPRSTGLSAACLADGQATSTAKAGGPVPWRFFVTTGSVVRRDCALNVGGFRTDITYGVDPALASRLRRNDPNGLVYSPNATFEMLGPSSLTGISEKLELFGKGLALLSAEDPTILSWTRLASIERPMSGALLRSERIARFVRSLAARTQGLPQRLSVRYLLAHATAVGYHSTPRTPQ